MLGGASSLCPRRGSLAAAGTLSLGCTHAGGAARGRDCCMATSGEGRGGHVAEAASLRRALHVGRPRRLAYRLAPVGSARPARPASVTSCRRAQPAPCAHELQLHSRAVGLQQSVAGRSGCGSGRLSAKQITERLVRKLQGSHFQACLRSELDGQAKPTRQRQQQRLPLCRSNTRLDSKVCRHRCVACRSHPLVLQHATSGIDALLAAVTL